MKILNSFNLHQFKFAVPLCFPLLSFVWISDSDSLFNLFTQAEASSEVSVASPAPVLIEIKEPVALKKENKPIVVEMAKDYPIWLSPLSNYHTVTPQNSADTFKRLKDIAEQIGTYEPYGNNFAIEIYFKNLREGEFFLRLYGIGKWDEKIKKTVYWSTGVVAFTMGGGNIIPEPGDSILFAHEIDGRDVVVNAYSYDGFDFDPRNSYAKYTQWCGYFARVLEYYYSSKYGISFYPKDTVKPKLKSTKKRPLRKALFLLLQSYFSVIFLKLVVYRHFLFICVCSSVAERCPDKDYRLVSN